MKATTYSFSSHKVAILGFGVEGLSAANFLLKHGAKICIFDEKKDEDFDGSTIESLEKQGAQFIFGKIPGLQDFDDIVRSPGVPLSIESLQEAFSRKQNVTSVTKLFFDLCPCPIIGVTGTKGKGTTSTLIYQMLREQGEDVYLGGNIGVPALDFLEKLTINSKVVLELSSFQLIDLEKSPHIAVMLMVTSEHLDYHKDVNEYVAAKRNILAHQSPQDFAIINKDYPASRESDIYTPGHVLNVSREAEVEEGACVVECSILVDIEGAKAKIIDTKDILLPGKHNYENVCAAVVASLLAGVEKKYIVHVLKTFKGLEHRLELVRNVHGVRYYDDSFSTTPETSIAAIESFTDPEILILGGSSKNSDFQRLGQIVTESENIKALIGIGKEWKRIKSSIQDASSRIQMIEDCKNMKEIVEKAEKIAESGDVVLLSPACASFDMFKNYKERGDQFKREVKRL